MANSYRPCFVYCRCWEYSRAAPLRGRSKRSTRQQARARSRDTGFNAAASARFGVPRQMRAGLQCGESVAGSTVTLALVCVGEKQQGGF